MDAINWESAKMGIEPPLTIKYDEKGKVRKLTKAEKLAQEDFERAQMDQAWAENFPTNMFKLMALCEKYPQLVRYSVRQVDNMFEATFEFDTQIYVMYQAKREDWIPDLVVREIEDYERQIEEERKLTALRNSGLSKLTHEEKVALGFAH